MSSRNLLYPRFQQQSLAWQPALALEAYRLLAIVRAPPPRHGHLSKPRHRHRLLLYLLRAAAAAAL